MLRSQFQRTNPSANSFMKIPLPLLIALLSTINSQLSTAFAFEGRLRATLTRGGEVETFLYTVGTNQLRIECGETDFPHAKNLVNLDTGAITLLFPHNRSFVRLKSEGAHMPTRVPADAPSAGIGPTNLPGAPAPPTMPQMPQLPQMPAAGGGMPAMPAMPMMPMPGEALELKATDQTTNLLGYACTRYELKQRGEVMEIWATAKLMPFQPYLQNQPPRFGPRMIEEKWGELMKAKKLFPLSVVLRFENGPERLRFEVKSVTPEKIEDRAGALFQPPPDYQEIQPLPF